MPIRRSDRVRHFRMPILQRMLLGETATVFLLEFSYATDSESEKKNDSSEMASMWYPSGCAEGAQCNKQEPCLSSPKVQRFTVGSVPFDLAKLSRTRPLKIGIGGSGQEDIQTLSHCTEACFYRAQSRWQSRQHKWSTRTFASKFCESYRLLR